MSTSSLFESETWAQQDSKRAVAEQSDLPWPFELMDRVRVALDAGDWAAMVLPVEQLIERIGAGEYDASSPVRMVGWQRYRGIAPEIVHDRLEHLRAVLHDVSTWPKSRTSRTRRSAPNAEARAAKIVAQLNKSTTPDV